MPVWQLTILLVQRWEATQEMLVSACIQIENKLWIKTILCDNYVFPLRSSHAWGANSFIIIETRIFASRWIIFCYTRAYLGTKPLQRNKPFQLTNKQSSPQISRLMCLLDDFSRSGGHQCSNTASLTGRVAWYNKSHQYHLHKRHTRLHMQPDKYHKQSDLRCYLVWAWQQPREWFG